MKNDASLGNWDTSMNPNNFNSDSFDAWSITHNKRHSWGMTSLWEADKALMDSQNIELALQVHIVKHKTSITKLLTIDFDEWSSITWSLIK
jgi:hypothetical protein